MQSNDGETSLTHVIFLATDVATGTTLRNYVNKTHPLVNYLVDMGPLAWTDLVAEDNEMDGEHADPG